MQQPVIQQIEDGTHTLFSPHFKQYYHSLLGAKQESDRVFLEVGLQEAFTRFSSVQLLEIGFGTGLNALLSWDLAQNQKRSVAYDGLEAYPLATEIVQSINLGLATSQHQRLIHLHELSWDTEQMLDSYFTLTKICQKIEDFTPKKLYNLVYYDAFAPESQPEMWTESVFLRLRDWMVQGGFLTTYCAKGYVKRNLKAAGFQVEKHAGPKRKREMIRAIKL